MTPPLSSTALQGATEKVSGTRGQRDGGAGATWVLDPGSSRGGLPARRIMDMSKVSMSSRPEPGYENMDHFSVNVDYVAEMLRTIEFQTGAALGQVLLCPGGCPGLPGVSSPHMDRAPPTPHALHGCASPCAQEWDMWLLIRCPGTLWGQTCPTSPLAHVLLCHTSPHPVGCPQAAHPEEGEPWLTCPLIHRAAG